MRCMTRKMDGGAKGYRTESGREEWVEIIKGNFRMDWDVLYREKGYSGTHKSF